MTTRQPRPLKARVVHVLVDAPCEEHGTHRTDYGRCPVFFWNQGYTWLKEIDVDDTEFTYDRLS